MKVFDNFKSKNIDELVDWLDRYGCFDGSPWMYWFDNNYCQKCDIETVYIPSLKKDMECSWCELHDKCKFFQELEKTPDSKQIIKMWLESEI